MLRFSTPPLSGKSLTGSGFPTFTRSVFEGKKKAFTLAEVLITLVIIGVVAALTIPNLMQKYQEQTTVKKVQKFYSNLSNAYALAMKDNGPASEWGLTGFDNGSSIKIYEILFKPYFKIAKNCGLNNTDKCVARHFGALNNKDSAGGWLGGEPAYKLVLDDSSSLVFFSNTIGETYIYYDTNGTKEPNQWGIDLFQFVISKSSWKNPNKIVPMGLPNSNYPASTTCKKTSTGEGCAAWLIYKGNMDYLHCDGLKWTSKSCKEK